MEKLPKAEQAKVQAADVAFLICPSQRYLLEPKDSKTWRSPKVYVWASTYANLKRIHPELQGSREEVIKQLERCLRYDAFKAYGEGYGFLQLKP